MKEKNKKTKKEKQKMITNFISVGTQQLLIELFNDKDNKEVLHDLSKLSEAEQCAIRELLDESGC
jgi:predicted PhzF superfamily epimerase YddE/YHI9